MARKDDLNLANRFGKPPMGFEELRLKVPKDIAQHYQVKNTDEKFVSAFFEILYNVRQDQDEKTRESLKERFNQKPSVQKIEAAEDLVSILFDNQDKLEDSLSEEDFTTVESLMMTINNG